MNVSRAAREKCFELARKRIKSHEKWGRWLAAVLFFLGLLQFGLGIGFVFLVQRFGQLWGNAAQQFQGAAAQGMAMGMLGGFMSGVAIFLGMHHMYQGIGCVRGNPADQMLVEYDALLALLRSRAISLDSLPDAALSQEPGPLDQPDD